MSERLDPGFRAGLDPLRRLWNAVRLLRSIPGRLRYTISRDLDAKPQDLIDAALRHASASGRMPVCIAASFPLSPGEIEQLSEEPAVSGIVTKQDPRTVSQLKAEFPRANIGAFWEPGLWLLPDGARHVYFIGSWRLVTMSMLREAFRHQVVTLTTRCAWEWLELPLGPIRRIAAGRRRAWLLARRTLDYYRAVLSRLGGVPDKFFLFVRPVSRAALEAGFRVVRPVSRSALEAGFRTDRVRPVVRAFDAALLNELISAAQGQRRPDVVPGRVVLVCGNLQPGGAERQVAYTASGLAQTGVVESVRLLCDMLSPNHPARYDFYLPLLERAGVQVSVVQRIALDRAMVKEPAALAFAQTSFPEGLLLDVANLYQEFVRLRPEVVHAWLDWSNTRAGLAAALAGVPRILLSGRNLNPTHFALYQPYMEPVYQALQRLPQVMLLNNSCAGAQSYANWLGISPDRITIIYNGLEMGKVDGDRGREVRMRHGIPADAPLIGGVFRFNSEKRPFLWIEAAAAIAQHRNDAWFILFGQGDLQSEMEKRARGLGIADRLVMPGVTYEVLPAMQALDVFLLTSYGEGVPNVVLEAQSVGTPVVATNAGGVAEAVDLDASGWILDTTDPGQLAERVCWLLSDAGARQRARIAGPVFVSSRFGLERMINETLQVYNLA